MRAHLPVFCASLRRRAAAALLGSLVALAGCGPAEPEEKLNFIVVTIDTTRADALGAYGQELPSSPRLDALAAKGVLFEQAVTSVPMTLPSHASIMTAKQPYAHGARGNSGYLLTAENVTLAEVLSDAGYRTAAEIAAPVIGRRTLMNQGFDQYRDLESGDIRRIEVVIGKDEKKQLIERAASDITMRGIEFLQSVGDEPFFLWLHYFDPHVFHNAPPLFEQLVPTSPYHAEIRYVDAEFGFVIDTLRRLELADNTLVVVTSDHGESRGEHGERTHSFFVYDGTMRVPLIFWGPGIIPEPRRVASLVRNIDIAPTILDYAGLPPLEDVQGVSLRPLIEGRETDLGLTGYGESITLVQMFGISLLRYVREGNWKYIHKVSPELYDIGADPGELDNAAARRPDVLARLRTRLRALIEEAPETVSDATTSVDATTQAHLQALGYVAAPPPAAFDELASLDVEGLDPSTLTDDALLYSRALAHVKTNQVEEAEEIYRGLYERHPKSAPALLGLVQTLFAQGRRDEAEPLLRQGLALETRSVEFRLHLAALLAARGDDAEAEQLLAEALEMEPCSVQAWVRLSNSLHAQQRHADQIRTLETAVSTCPDASDLRNDLAYALATTPADDLRDGPRALELAKRAVSETGPNPAYLDTLACAFAETGNYEQALSTSRRATRMMEEAGAPEEALEVFRAHVASFEAGEPVRDHGGT